MSTDKAMKMSSELVKFYAPTFGQENAIRLVGRKVAIWTWRPRAGEAMIQQRWTDELKNAVAAMIIEGLSYRQIGAEIGRPRNAISGMINRNPDLIPPHLKPKVGGSKPRDPDAPKRVYLRQMFKPKVIALPKFEVPTEAPISKQLTLMQRSLFECVFPTHSEGTSHLFCGHATTKAETYCGYHARLRVGSGTVSERRAA